MPPPLAWTATSPRPVSFLRLRPHFISPTGPAPAATPIPIAGNSKDQAGSAAKRAHTREHGLRWDSSIMKPRASRCRAHTARWSARAAIIPRTSAYRCGRWCSGSAGQVRGVSRRHTRRAVRGERLVGLRVVPCGASVEARISITRAACGFHSPARIARCLAGRAIRTAKRSPDAQYCYTARLVPVCSVSQRSVMFLAEMVAGLLSSSPFRLSPFASPNAEFAIVLRYTRAVARISGETLTRRLVIVTCLTLASTRGCLAKRQRHATRTAIFGLPARTVRPAEAGGRSGYAGIQSRYRDEVSAPWDAPERGLCIVSSAKVFANVGRQCQDCHANLHRRQFGAACQDCHSVQGCKSGVQAIRDHQNRFPLLGAHAVAPCESCHRGAASAASRA